jgi:hypothetical protein
MLPDFCKITFSIREIIENNYGPFSYGNCG